MANIRHSQIFNTHLFIHLVGKKAVFVPEFLLNANKHTNVHKRHTYTLTHIYTLTQTCRYTHIHVCIHLTTLKHVHSTLTCLYTHTHTHTHISIHRLVLSQKNVWQVISLALSFCETFIPSLHSF